MASLSLGAGLLIAVCSVVRLIKGSGTVWGNT